MTFAENQPQSCLEEKDLRLIGLVSAVARGDWHALVEIRKAAPAGEPDREWREALLQSHLFLGFPRIVEAFEQLAQVGGLGHPTEAEIQGSEPSSEQWDQQGAPLFDTIYGDLAEPVRRRMRQHHLDFGAWIAEHAYGRVLARPGLAGHKREWLALVCLILTGLERQLASHTRGAMRLGSSWEQALEVLDSQREFLAGEEYERLLGTMQRFGVDSPG